MPFKSSVPMFWRLKRSKYNLIGTRCTTCKSVFFPPRPLCIKCRRKGNLEDFQFSGKGEIVTYTIIRIPPEGFEIYAPYAVGIIKLEEGPTISGQIVGDSNKIKIGDKVSTVFRKMYEDGKDGLIYYGLKWEIAK